MKKNSGRKKKICLHADFFHFLCHGQPEKKKSECVSNYEDNLLWIQSGSNCLLPWKCRTCEFIIDTCLATPFLAFHYRLYNFFLYSFHTLPPPPAHHLKALINAKSFILYATHLASFIKTSIYTHHKASIKKRGGLHPTTSPLAKNVHLHFATVITIGNFCISRDWECGLTASPDNCQLAGSCFWLEGGRGLKS